MVSLIKPWSTFLWLFSIYIMGSLHFKVGGHLHCKPNLSTTSEERRKRVYECMCHAFMARAIPHKVSCNCLSCPTYREHMLDWPQATMSNYVHEPACESKMQLPNTHLRFASPATISRFFCQGRPLCHCTYLFVEANERISTNTKGNFVLLATPLSLWRAARCLLDKKG